MTFQEQFLQTESKVNKVLVDLGMHMTKYVCAGPSRRFPELSRGEFEDGNRRKFGWCAMVNDYPLVESEPAGLMLRFLSCDANVPAGLVSDWVENEEQFQEFMGRNFPDHAA